MNQDYNMSVVSPKSVKPDKEERIAMRVEQLRWEIAAAKSQAALSKEIDNFLKEDSQRTVPTTLLAEDSTGSFISEWNCEWSGRNSFNDFEPPQVSFRGSDNMHPMEIVVETGLEDFSVVSETCPHPPIRSSGSIQPVLPSLHPKFIVFNDDEDQDVEAQPLPKREHRRSSKSKKRKSSHKKKNHHHHHHHNHHDKVGNHFESGDYDSYHSQHHHSQQHQPKEIIFDRNMGRSLLLDEPNDESDLALFDLCDKGDWFSVRAWLDVNSISSIKQGLLVRGRSQMTAMHIACTNNPPLYLVFRFAAIAPEACQLADFAGRLPIHHAIVCGADERVVDVLVKAFPESLKIQDKSGLLPLKSKSVRSQKLTEITASMKGMKMAELPEF